MLPYKRQRHADNSSRGHKKPTNSTGVSWRSPMYLRSVSVPNLCEVIQNHRALPKYRSKAFLANQKTGYKNSRLPSWIFSHYFCRGARAEQRV